MKGDSERLCVLEGVNRLKAAFGKSVLVLKGLENPYLERAVWQEQRLLFLDIVGNVFGIFPCFISLLPLFLKKKEKFYCSWTLRQKSLSWVAKWFLTTVCTWLADCIGASPVPFY